MPHTDTIEAMEKITINELKGLDLGNLYGLLFVYTRAQIEKQRKFVGYYKARKLFVEPDGSFLIESY